MEQGMVELLSRMFRNWSQAWWKSRYMRRWSALERNWAALRPPAGKARLRSEHRGRSAIRMRVSSLP